MTDKLVKVTEGWKGPGRRDAVIDRLKAEDDGKRVQTQAAFRPSQGMATMLGAFDTWDTWKA